MSVAEIKNDLHKMVVETDDIVLLQYFQQHFKAMIDDTYDWFDDLTNDQKIKVNQGLEDLKNGNSISNTEMRTKINAFFDQKTAK